MCSELPFRQERRNGWCCRHNGEGRNGGWQQSDAAVAQGIAEATGKEYNLKITAKNYEQDTVDAGTMVSNSSSAMSDQVFENAVNTAAVTMLSSTLLCVVASFAIIII